MPAHRVAALLQALTGTAPSTGFVHGLLARTAGLLAGVHDRIRTLITLAYAVCCDETPLKVGPKTPRAGRKKAERYLLVACTDLYTHYLLGDRSLETFKTFVPPDVRDALITRFRHGVLVGLSDQDRYTIRGYISTAVKHGRNALTVLSDALLGRPWIPDLPAAPT